METFSAPAVSFEEFPKPPKPEKRRRSVSQEKKQEIQKPEIQGKDILHEPARRRFASGVLGILRKGLNSEPSPDKPAQEPLKKSSISTPETKPEDQTFMVERARSVGRSVLKFVRRLQGDVEAADKKEKVISPTDIQPLVVAEADVKAAMQELIAPIIAYGEERGIPQEDIADIGQIAVGEKEVESVNHEQSPDHGGGDGFKGEVIEAPSKYAADIAASVAESTAAEILDAKERAEKRTNTVRKIGVFALGAATVGGFMYTWRRIRELKRQQEKLKREQQHFEIEVRAHQKAEELRLQQFEATSISEMNQPQRQEFVHEASQFAHQQAAEIRSVANHSQENRNLASEVPVAPRVVETPNAIHTPERKLPSKRATIENSEKPSVAEKLIGIKKKNNIADGHSGFGGGISLGARAMAILTGHPPVVAKTQVKNQPMPQLPTQPMQVWLLGILLGIGIIILLMIVIGFL